MSEIKPQYAAIFLKSRSNVALKISSPKQTFSERRSKRRSNFVSAELSAAHILTMSAELSAAQSLLSALMQNIHFRPCLALFGQIFYCFLICSELPIPCTPLMSKMDQNQAFKREYFCVNF